MRKYLHSYKTNSSIKGLFARSLLCASKIMRNPIDDAEIIIYTKNIDRNKLDFIMLRKINIISV